MSSEWQEVELQEIADFQNGYAFKSDEYVSGLEDSKEVLRMGYIKRGGGFKEDEKPVFAPKSSKGSERRYELDEGDIVIAMTDMKDRVAILGNCARIPCSNRFVLNQRVGRIRSKNEDIANQRFLYYYMNSSSQVHRLRSLANRGVQVNLTTASIIESPISLPRVKEQQILAHILGTLDDKIELNRKTNETLEAMAKALFKSWFVDFDPVRAKAEGRPTGLPAEISDLFPDSFEDSDLGEIPRGWKVKSLDEVAHFLNGLALQKFPPEDGAATLPVIKIAQLKKGDSTGADRCSTAVPSDYVVRDGDMLFSWSGSLAVDIWCGGDGALNQHLFKVTSKTYGKWFFYQWVNHHLPVFQEIAQGKATTMGHIQRRHLSEAKVLIPPPSLLAAMDSAFTALLDRAFGLRRQAKDLGSTRDALLPKLISGELRIPDAEKMLEEVGV
jgi:type I restriction enzyme S subunit